jgi:transcriptional regulator with XRE-family HTH domain/DNA polymerase III delta prime subunit
MQEYARRVRRERELHSWSQEQVAEKIGTTAPNVSRWERGKTFPDTYYRQKLCELFGKSAEELGLIQNDADEKSEQSPNQRAVVQDSNAPVLGASLSMRNQNRQRMLQKVRTFWITGVLEQSLQGTALITLGLHEQPDAVANPWELVLQQPDQLTHLLPPGTRITQVYDTMDGELLILGEPGSGKTTLLLELARDLLDRAMRDETHPLPVVFNLSSWAVKRQPLADWLVEELHVKYQVPRKLAREWVDTDQVLTLLDGLDEVTPSARTACAEAINAFRQEHGLLPAVVCCRSAEYATQKTRLLLQRAVTVQPLTAHQIDTYLLLAGEQLAALRTALQADPMLQELAATPLMLSVLMLAYHGKSVEDLPEAESLEIHRRQVFATYVQRMFQRRGTEIRYTVQQTIHWLTWLARQMTQHSQTEFYLEYMQPDCLSDRRSLRWYRGLVVGLVVGLIGGATAMNADLPLFNVISTLFHLPLTGVVAGDFLLAMPMVWLIYGLGFGLIGGLVGGLVGTLKRGVEPVVKLDSWRIDFRRRVVASLLFGLSFGVFFVLVNLLWVPYQVWSEGEMVRVSYGIVGGIIGGLFGGLVGIEESEITCVDLLVRSRVRLRRKVIATLFGAFIGVLLGELFLLITYGGDWSYVSQQLPRIVLIAGIAEGIVGALAGLFLSGVVRGRLEKHDHVRPNQGIRSSARNGLFGLLVGLAILGGGFVIPTCILTRGNIDYLRYDLGLALLFGVPLSLIIGLIIALLNGGYACIQHVVLRLFLRHKGFVPWNYPHFLDYAAERIILRKVGGGYIFLHRLLLEYFASLNDEQISKEKFRPIPQMNIYRYSEK